MFLPFVFQYNIRKKNRKNKGGLIYAWNYAHCGAV